VLIRIAEFDKKPAFHDDPELLERFRTWMRSQPGFLHGWHATDPETGRTVAVSIWNDRASLVALKDRPFPGGPLGAGPPDRLTIFEHAEAL
jgi:hypothetical protein